MKRIEPFIFGNLFLPLFYLLMGRRSLQLFGEYKRNESLSKEEICNLQWRKLRKLLDHAYRTVPFYKRRFKEAGAVPADITSLNDYTKLPVLTKRDLMDHLEEIVAQVLDRRELLFASTGGSTGIPVNYYQDRRYAYEVAAAGIWRSWSRTGFHPGERHLYIWGGPREIKEAQSLTWKVKHFMLRRFFIDSFDFTVEKLRWASHAAQQFQPSFVYGYASSVTAFAQHLIKEGIKIPGVRAAMTTAERLLPEQRQIIGRAFDCKVYDDYACREVRSVATECHLGKLHIYNDLNVVEFVQLEEVSKPDHYWLVLTPLELFGFPLLRYVNEDFAAPDSPCSCGLPFPTMKLQVGRVTDNFTLPSGRLVHGEYFTHLVYGLRGVRQFQFHQVAPARILFRICWDDPSPDHAEILEHLKALINEAQNYLGEGCRIELQEVEEIPLTASGKHRFTLSDVTPKFGALR